ncbi:2-dehydro-3-deoxygalactonokinase [Antarctobacter heliothermus]|uniref:2-dehydro-3-deoxygalactonokinase n=1 Tax=Antarctobacter heliothermus TaxID=74033 RepID=A0A239CWG8_9RHOB|nr:2-dehydro-3-deoxygalactonokinase [Antarctobacter heliothermus]SNS24259.1 2-dehydro-3-deoxygalactonokinase [Antarctobacter heliothermus]
MTTPAKTDAPKWIAADWGTSHLRLWPMGDDDRPLRRIDSDLGMSRLTPEAYEPTLLNLLGDDLPETLPVIICGMAGSRQGWAEAPYVETPCAVPFEAPQVATRDPRLRVHILPGIKQMRPPDVMRGEETQIGGFLAKEPGFDGVICLPGTHNKWVHVSANEIVSFRTFMTGELFALIGSQSVLRHSLGDLGWDKAAFAEAVSDTLSRPATLTSSLFTLRADSLLNGTGADVTRARLSGLLIGAELAAARPYWLGQDIVILGEDAVAGAYRDALTAQGAVARLVPAGDITLAGLTAAYTHLKDKT